MASVQNAGKRRVFFCRRPKAKPKPDANIYLTRSVCHSLRINGVYYMIIWVNGQYIWVMDLSESDIVGQRSVNANAENGEQARR